MTVRLNITLDETLYRRLKAQCPPKGISRFIAESVRARLYPDRDELEAGYKAAAGEAWRAELSEAWEQTDVEDWPS